MSVQLKLKINKGGTLEIERAGQYEQQYCPFQPSLPGDEHDVCCGDWCPMFDEPDPYHLDPDSVTLQICKKTFTLHKAFFRDERGTESPDEN
jgi:hypothetical protein